MPFSEHNTISAIMKSEQLWVLVLGLLKTACQQSVMARERTRGVLPLIPGLLIDSGKGASVSSVVHPLLSPPDSPLVTETALVKLSGS